MYIILLFNKAPKIIFCLEVVILRTKIDVLREKLNKLVKENANFQQIYDVSVKLDSQIVIYYKEMEKKKKRRVS